MHATVAEGIRCFNEGKFFEAHEALETVWLEAKGEEKLFLHGLIQISAAFHHYRRANAPGFHSLLEKGLKKLAGFGPARSGIDLAGLLAQLERWRGSLHTGKANRVSRRLPRIKLTFADL